MHLALGVCRKVGLHLLFQGKAALCQMGSTFVRKLELLFQLGDLFLPEPQCSQELRCS